MSNIKEDNYDGNIAGEQDHFQKVANAFLYYRYVGLFSGLWFF